MKRAKAGAALFGCHGLNSHGNCVVVKSTRRPASPEIASVYCLRTAGRDGARSAFQTPCCSPVHSANKKATGPPMAFLVIARFWLSLGLDLVTPTEQEQVARRSLIALDELEQDQRVPAGTPLVR